MADLTGDSFDVGTPVWMVSHPLGKRAYVSRGFITEWDPERAFFNHNIPSFPGSSGGRGGGLRVHVNVARAFVRTAPV